jgi:hypothetical protein
MRLEKGILIRTNYSGPYRIMDIRRGCTCPSYLDSIDMENPPAQRPHVDLVCSRPDGTGRFYLNGWIEGTLRSISKSFCG